MSIGRRLIDLARAELNSLLEKAASSDDDDERRNRETRSGFGGDPSSLSDEELSAEIERRREAKAEAEAALRGGRHATSRPSGRPSAPPPPRRTAAGDDAIRRAYAALEIPPGSSFEVVRQSYRRLMRKYHPDLHGGTPEKQRAATDLAQRLTESYKTLEKHLHRR